MTAMEKIRMTIALPIFLFGLVMVGVSAVVGGAKFATVVLDSFKRGLEQHV